MGVCSQSGPLPAVLHAPTALGGARGDVCVAALSGGTVKLCKVVLSTFPQPPKTPTEQNPIATLETEDLSATCGYQKCFRIQFFDSRPAV